MVECLDQAALCFEKVGANFSFQRASANTPMLIVASIKGDMKGVNALIFQLATNSTELSRFGFVYVNSKLNPSVSPASGNTRNISTVPLMTSSFVVGFYI